MEADPSCPTPGWSDLFLALLIFFSVPDQVLGMEPWQFYGIIELRTFVFDTDPQDGSAHVHRYDQFFETVKLGGKYKSGRLKARFELGDDQKLRRLWGKWKFGQVSFLVGKEYTPVYMDYCLEEFGGLSAGRQPMVQLRFQGLKIAVIKPRQKTLGVKQASKQVRIPKLEISYNQQTGPLGFEVAGGINRYTLEAWGKNCPVDSWVAALGADLKLGSAFLAASIYTGQNLGPYGLKMETDGNPVILENQVFDNTGMGWVFLARYYINQTLMAETGFGRVRTRVDTAPETDEARSWYFMVEYSPAPGLFIRPEVGIQDHCTDLEGNPQPKSLYYGIEWEINF